MNWRQLLLNITLVTATTLPTFGAVLYADKLVSGSETDCSIAYPNTSRNVAVASDGTIFVIFYNPNGIWVSKCANRGLTYDTPVKVSTTQAEAEIAVDANGVLHVAWSSGGQAYYSRSTDSGATFSAAVTLGSNSGGTHIATDAPYVYLVPQNGSLVWYNSDSGNGTFSSTSLGSSWVYSDVHVNPDTHDVYVQVDNPSVSVYKSTDHAQTFSAANAIGVSVYYSTTIFAVTNAGVFLYTAGYYDAAYRINVSDYSATEFTVGTTSTSRGRTLAVDAYSNVIDGYVDGTEVKYAISTDNGATFDAAVTIATADYLSLGLNPRYGDIVAVYQAGGKIYGTVYEGEITQPPGVDTAAASDVGTTTATSGGEVVTDGGDTVTARGVCWSTTSSPTIADSKTTDGSGTGAFTSEITGLSAETTYYVRAYATNSVGTAYGNEVEFTTTAVPALDITVESDDNTAGVGDNVTFQVTVTNSGSSGTTNIVLTFPLPSGTEFVSASYVTDQTAQTTDPNAYVQNDTIYVEIDEIDGDSNVKLNIVLRASTAGTITLNASATSDQNQTPVTAQASNQVEVEDVELQVVTTISPLIPVCGPLGLSPAFILLSLVGLKRRQQR